MQPNSIIKSPTNVCNMHCMYHVPYGIIICTPLYLYELTQEKNESPLMILLY